MFLKVDYYMFFYLSLLKIYKFLCFNRNLNGFNLVDWRLFDDNIDYLFMNL